MCLKKWQMPAGASSKTTGEKEQDDLVFTRQMAALYNKDAYDGKERVLEIHFTDLDHTYQIQLSKTGSEVFTDGRLSPTTRIDTPFTVWSAISRGEIGGSRSIGETDVYGIRRLFLDD